MTECELIAAARLGNDDAFARLHQLHAGYVRGVARSIMHSNDVEDICQDTFLLAFTRLHSFEGTAQFRTWLTRIAVNQCLISLRKGTSQRVELEDADNFARKDPQLEGVAARIDVNKLLRRLRPGQRLVLEMAYLDGMPDQEIADALNTTLASVKSKIYQAKRRIRKVARNN
jgi:RNA polymerase sigma-70 factor, ECF subfamily